MLLNDHVLALYIRAQITVSTLAARARAPRGQGLVEYALIIAFISIAVIAAITFLGARTSHTLVNFGNTLGNANATPTPITCTGPGC